MSRANLFLWILVEPVTILGGAAAAVLAYRYARPREGTHCGELLVEGWRMYALLTGIVAFALGAEFTLWSVALDYRSPLAFTKLIDAAGVCLVAAAPAPLMLAYCRNEELRGRPVKVAAALLASGVALAVVAPAYRDYSWSRLTRNAGTDQESLHELVSLKSYRYVSDERARRALDSALAAPTDVLQLVESARDSGAPPLDSFFMRPYLADRITEALRDPPPGDPSALRARAIPAYWWMTADPAATLESYAVATAPLGSEAQDAAARDPQRAIRHALANESEPLIGVLLEAFHALRARAHLEPATIDALIAHLDDPAPTGRTALAILLEEASVASLRPILPRFTDESSPAWEVLRSNCPRRTHGLITLAEGDDEEVSAGAKAVLAYVREYCSDWSLRPGG